MEDKMIYNKGIKDNTPKLFVKHIKDEYKDEKGKNVSCYYCTAYTFNVS